MSVERELALRNTVCVAAGDGSQISIRAAGVVLGRGMSENDVSDVAVAGFRFSRCDTSPVGGDARFDFGRLQGVHIDGSAVSQRSKRRLRADGVIGDCGY